MQTFSEHVLHVIAGGMLVGGLIFGLLALLIYIDKRKNKRVRKRSKNERQGKKRTQPIGRKTKRPKKR